MAFKIRRGTNAERLTIIPAQGELIYTTDTKKLYIGDGSTTGGVAVDNGLATTTYVDTQINNLVDGAASTLNTLKELADALGSDPNFASNLTTTLSTKLDNSDTNSLNPGDMYFTKTGDTVGMGSLAGQSITAGPNGIQIAGTGGVQIMGVATSTVKLGGQTSGSIIFESPTSGINYNDLSNTPTGMATETYVDNAVAGLVNNASSTLDTLKELADALGNDQNFATTITTSLGQKANVSDLANVATSGDYADLQNVPFTPNLSNVGQNILPDTDVTWDIGSPQKRFRDIYLSSNTIYLGESALGIDPVKGLQVKSFGGGEGYGAGSVEWLATGAAYGVLHALKFNGVDISHPLYTYLSNLKIGDQIKEAVPPNNPTFVPPADFLLTITEPVQFGNIVPDGFGGQLYDEVVIPVDQSRTTGSTYYVFYVEFRNNPITSIDNIPDPDGILPTATQAGWPEYGDLGITTLRGDQTVFIRPSWDRNTVDFQFKEDGTLQLPPGGDIVDSAGASVLFSGSYNDLSDTPTIPVVPTALSSFTNDTNFITLSDVPTIPTDVSDLTDTTGLLGGGGGIALTDLSVGPDAAASGSGAVSYDDTTGVFTYTPPALFDGQYASLTGAPTIPADVSDLTDTNSLLFDGQYASLTGAPTIPTDTGDLTNNAGFITLSDVPAPFSGSYNDLTDTPTIPADISDLTDTTGLLSGGGGGIALTDLSVGPAATASGSGAISYDDTTGVFTYTPPETVVEIATDTTTVGAGSYDTIWTDADGTNTMAKLLVNGVEATTGDSQSLEVLITKKSDNTVASTVYAIVYTSANPIFTVVADWNAGSSRMILDAIVPGANNISFTVRSVTTEPGVGIAGGGSGLGNSDFSDILVVSAQAAGYWTSYSLTGDYAAVFNYQGNAVLSLTNQTVYGHQFAGGDKVLFINDAAINSNHYGLVIEFPSTPQLGDVVSVAVMGDSEVVTAGNFVIGRQYTVKDVGDTVWTNVGGQSSVGYTFTATGVGSGTGTAYAALGVDRRIFKPASGQRIRIMAAGGNTASYYIGENETYKGAYIPTIGGQEAQTLLFTYVGVIGGTPTWYQLYF